MQEGRAHRLGWGLLVLSLAVGCALPKPTHAPAPRPVAVKAVPVAQNLGTLVGTVQGPSAGLIANNSAGVLANNSAGLIANNSAGLRLLGGSSRLEPVAGARVEVVDAASGDVLAEPVTTGPEGRYTVGRLKASGPLLFVRVTYEREGQLVTLLGMVAAARKAGAVDVPVNPATTLVAKKLQTSLRQAAVTAADLAPASFETFAEALARAMSDKAIVAAAILESEKAAGAFDAMLAESTPLRDAFAETDAAQLSPGSPAPTSEPGAATPTPAPTATPGGQATPSPTPTVNATATPAAEAEWTVSTLAGDGQPGSRNGTGTGARFNLPEGLTLGPNGILYVADGGNDLIRTITIDGQVRRVPEDEIDPTDVVFDPFGHLFAVEAEWHHVHGVDTDGSEILFAGLEGGFADGRAEEAAFQDPLGIASDASGTVYIADTGNDRIRLLTQDRHVTTLAVTGLSGPADLVVAPDGTLYATEVRGHRISAISPAGVRSTLVGGLASPRGLAIDRHGNLYVADTGNHRICKVTPAGTLTVLAGDGSAGFAEGTAARFSSPVGVAVNADGTVIYVGDRDNHRIRVIR